MTTANDQWRKARDAYERAQEVHGKASYAAHIAWVRLQAMTNQALKEKPRVRVKAQSRQMAGAANEA
jgi:hypothetical protein